MIQNGRIYNTQMPCCFRKLCFLIARDKWTAWAANWKLMKSLGSYMIIGISTLQVIPPCFVFSQKAIAFFRKFRPKHYKYGWAYKVEVAQFDCSLKVPLSALSTVLSCRCVPPYHRKRKAFAFLQGSEIAYWGLKTFCASGCRPSLEKSCVPKFVWLN